MKIDTLNNLNLEETAYIIENDIKTENKQNLINLGITKNTKVKCLYKSPFSDPTAYLVKNVILAINTTYALRIRIMKLLWMPIGKKINKEIFNERG